MKRFFFKGFLLFLAVSVTLLALNFFYVRTTYFSQKDDLSKFSDVPENLEIVNLGSSHGQCAFDYSELPLKGFNFSLSSQDFFYDLSILSQYQENLVPQAVVLIPVSLFSFGVEREEPDSTFQEINPRYYRFLRNDLIYEFSFKKALRYRVLPILSANGNLIRIVWDSSKSNRLAESRNLIASTEWEKVGKERAEFHISIFDETNFKENQNLLKQIVGFCREAGFHPILITTPLSKWYLDPIPTEIWGRFHDLVESVSGELDVPYLDYSQDPDFYEEMDLFLDTDHLNLTGRKLFTQKVFHELEPLFDKQ